ncbi:pyridoxamine 5'-phosphate oxidase family protein [Acuticoccus sp.]|uniref:pyridoxamine 5'-phosphate oxidase family protein n=1 Tax=Acuticoccus sp. TaxID=1904378 RepID=UPI003B52F5E5
MADALPRVADRAIRTIEELEALYGEPPVTATVKVTPAITPHYRTLIEASPFVALATVGPEGLDCSPRGDVGPVVDVLGPRHLALPDRRGNNRIDSLRNIVRDPRVALMFLIPGSGTVMRVNGRAVVSGEQELLARYVRDGKEPRTVILVEVGEVYFQCARAVLRSGLWDGGHADVARLPSVGTVVAELAEGFDGARYDAEWPDRARQSLW